MSVFLRSLSVVRYVDGLEFAKVQNHCVAAGGWFTSAAADACGPPFDRPYHLLLNLAVGGQLPAKAPSQSTPFSQVMLVRTPNA